jgi:hypothetical protein
VHVCMHRTNTAHLIADLDRHIAAGLQHTHTHPHIHTHHARDLIVHTNTKDVTVRKIERRIIEPRKFRVPERTDKTTWKSPVGGGGTGQGSSPNISIASDDWQYTYV